MESEVSYTVEGGIAVIALNRPEKHNAINQALLASLYDSLELAAADDSIRVAVLTGRGKSFCSGIDLDAIATDNLFDPRDDGKDFPDIIGTFQKPLIGAINGAAVTGGLEMALNCDVIIASEQARFADTHIRVGIHPGWGMSQLLQEAIGRRRAFQMSLSCQFIDAGRAYEWGLANEVVPHEQLMPRAMEIARDICAADQGMLKTVKTLIEYRSSASFRESLNHERNEFRRYLKEHWEYRSSGGAE